MQRFTPELIDAARPSRHVAGDRWFVDETYRDERDQLLPDPTMQRTARLRPVACRPAAARSLRAVEGEHCRVFINLMGQNNANDYISHVGIVESVGLADLQLEVLAAGTAGSKPSSRPFA